MNSIAAFNLLRRAGYKRAPKAAGDVRAETETDDCLEDEVDTR
jgi:hypothetical protein